MVSPALIAQLLQQQYAGANIFDFVDQGSTNGVYWCAKKLPDVTVILFRGSQTFEDWKRDFEALPQEIHQNPELGPIHKGFSQGLYEAVLTIRAKTTGPRILAGHSLGAARAAIASAVLKSVGEIPVARFGFGEPHPGFPKLRARLAGIPYHLFKTCKGMLEDPVTLVPLLPFCASGDMEHLEVAKPIKLASELHHIQNYVDCLMADHNQPGA